MHYSLLLPHRLEIPSPVHAPGTAGYLSYLTESAAAYNRELDKCLFLILDEICALETQQCKCLDKECDDNYLSELNLKSKVLVIDFGQDSDKDL